MGAAPPSGVPLVVVHVVGQVLRPGIVRLPPAPGSSTPSRRPEAPGRGADLAGINLARLVVDGEQIRVPRPGEVVAGAPGPRSGPGRAPAPGRLVSLNSADVTALDSLPGIGPVLAQRIVDWRTENGRFTSVDELGEVARDRREAPGPAAAEGHGVTRGADVRLVVPALVGWSGLALSLAAGPSPHGWLGAACLLLAGGLALAHGR